MIKNNLHKDLSEVMAAVAYVKKDGKNDFHKYSYASAEAVLTKVNSELAKRSICVTSGVELLNYSPGHAVVKMRLTLTRDGETAVMEGCGEGSDKGDKAVMKASTAALKYALASGFLISWGDDPEADTTTDTASKSFSELKSRIEAARSPDSLEDARKLVSAAVNKNELNQRQLTTLKKLYEEAKEQYA